MKKIYLMLFFAISIFAYSQSPVANFGYSVVPLKSSSITVNYTDQSTGVPTTYSWSFTGGDVSTSTVANPTVVYSTDGVFNVSLTVTNAVSSSTISSTIKINNGKIVDVSTGKNDDGSLMGINSLPDNDWVQIKPDGSTVTPTTRETYTGWSYAQLTPGVQSSVWITGGGITEGYYDYISKSFEVPANSSFAEISLRNLCFVRSWTYLVKENQDGSFTDTEITRTQWINNRFVGWLNSYNPLVDKLQVAPGKYHVKVRVYTNNTSVRESIDVNSYVEHGKAAVQNVAQYTTNNRIVCRNTPVEFFAGTVGNPVSYNWSFTDGPNTYTSTAQNPSITFTRNGAKNVNLTVTYADGSTSTLSTVGYINVRNNNCPAARAKQDFLIHPNPATLELVLEETAKSYQIYNLQGKVMISSEKETDVIDVSSLKKGNYLLRVTLENGEIYTKSFIKN